MDCNCFERIEFGIEITYQNSIQWVYKLFPWLMFSHWFMFELLLPKESNRLEYLIPKRTSLKHRLPMGDQGFTDFVGHLLEINPIKHLSASEALKHPWLSYLYEPMYFLVKRGYVNVKSFDYHY
ncbi:hypothetical protein HID58_029049 [Brassica napus]|uniref:Protein kinase domain-containing protein n=1 Tax=Brassica napus TaxID=3708 RepID=A0ABQ8CDI8_BRANA|nr:hypothetical protein HID58_029049 [Brassica napus]